VCRYRTIESKVNHEIKTAIAPTIQQKHWRIESAMDIWFANVQHHLSLQASGVAPAREMKAGGMGISFIGSLAFFVFLGHVDAKMDKK
jgi:hypothetical protein